MLHAGILVLLAVGAVAVTVPTDSGDVMGYTVTREKLGSHVFRGIPYAAPPVGKLRWAPPTAPTPWKTPFNASEDGAGCPQECMLPPMACPPRQSEDCLTLNVFTPLGATKGAGYPVMVWLHGGNFFQGYGGGVLYDGSYIVNRSKVIIVSVTYRLGALGFYAAGNLKGSYGYQDQQQAMRWVQTNIANFGGDPKQVTLWGQSAGAMSIALHMTDPVSDPLFHAAIMQSEPFSLPFRSPESMQPLAKALSDRLSCILTDVDCLRNVSANAVLEAQIAVMKDISASISNFLHAFVPWTPIVGDGVLSDPTASWLQGKIQDKPFILGNVALEARIFVWEATSYKPMSSIMYAALVESIFGLFSDTAMTVLKRYPANSTTDVRERATQVATEFIFECPNRNISRVVSQTQRKSPFYYYIVDKPMTFGKEVWTNDPECWDYTCHGGDLAFTWAQQYNPALQTWNITYTEGEKQLSDIIVDHFTSFAITGQPTQKTVPWEAYKATTEPTMHYTTNDDSTAQNCTVIPRYTLPRYNCAFWDATVNYDPID